MYCELHCKTNYSFLGAASHADELVQRAVELGYQALAITDENSLAGIVRAWTAARETSLKLIVGAELTFRDSPPLVVWAENRQGYGNLCRLITTGRRRAPKGSCWLEFNDLLDFHEGLLAAAMPCLDDEREPLSHISPGDDDFEWFGPGDPRPDPGYDYCMDGGEEATFAALAEWERQRRLLKQVRQHRLMALKGVFGDRLWLLASFYRGADDGRRLSDLRERSRNTGIPLVAAGDVLYHDPARGPLHDVLTAVRHGMTVSECGRAGVLRPNAWRHLHSVEERLQQYSKVPEALEAAAAIADRCQFRLDQLCYEYPRELAPDGLAPFEYLQRLTWEGARHRWPDGIPDKVRQQIEHELALIAELHYEAYFLTVWDLVRFARERGILCQGRGSAANSAVCYALGVTSVDPTSTELLFERFISRERNEAPDIDIDFEHERREEVLQYLYGKYGRERTGLAATVITWRTRSAVRDVGKALGLSLDRVDALAKQVDGYQNADDLPVRCRAAGIDPASDTGRRLCELVDQILGFPRHLSQHVGGMVMTEGRIDELVPVENAAMDDRTVIQWDKEDLEELGLLKVDCLCLGMLTAIRKCFQMVQRHWGRELTLASIPQGDMATYDMICAADTVGVFQIESRGQMSMLPRLKPRCWYDLVIEVAIVRPGPIQGNMVHPYLRRRNGEEPVTYPNDAIRAVLDRTLGVPLFQEQAMKLAVVAAGFTPGEADQLRRAMGAWRKTGVIEKFREKLMNGMRERGLTGEFAEAVLRQIRGFGEYGFPESHAASFALLVYVSAWLKRHYPAAFTAAILNSQPMGFYAPAQLVADARRHGVMVLPPDVNFSEWDCSLEEQPQAANAAGNGPESTAGQFALRLGLRQIAGLSDKAAQRVVARREMRGRYSSVAEFTRRTKLGQATVRILADAGAFGSLEIDRREAMWQALGQDRQALEMPLFAGIDDEDDPIDGLLPQQPRDESIAADYATIGLSLGGHPIALHRQRLDALGAVAAEYLAGRCDGDEVCVAGLVIMRQRPSTAKGITFVTLEDETGVINLVVRPHVWERHRQVCRLSTAWLAFGDLENRSGVIHVVVTRIDDLGEQIAASPHIRSRDFR